MLSVRVDFDKPLAWSRAAPAQIQHATAHALNRTAKDVQRAEQDTIRRVFDRPTSYVLHSMYVKTASANDMAADVGFKEVSNSRRLSGWDVLKPHIEGGGRRMTWSEIKIFGNYYVPTRYAKLDSHGNFPAAQLVAIMAQLKLLDDERQWASKSPVSRAKRLNLTYFKVGLKLGEGAIMMRVNGGRDAVPVLVEVARAPQYRKRFPYWEVADKTIRERLSINWDTAVRYQMHLAADE